MKISPIIPALALLVLLPFTVSAQVNQNGGQNGALGSTEIDRIVQAFTAKEIQFRRALNQYSFKRDVLVQKVGMGGQVIGEYHRVSNFTFDDQGTRYEKITFFPMSTMPEITQEDIDQMGGINPFAIEPNKIGEYAFHYVGKEKIDELNLYVFEVTPKVMPNPKKTKEKLFAGRVWVDDQDLQIVKTKGKGVPETKDNKFPTVETYREHIDGRYWFPTFTYADEELIFDNGSSIHVRMKVRYSDFTFTEAKLKVVTEVGEADEPSSASKGVAKPLEVGALNAKAVLLPKPVFPEEARRIRSSGRVTVRVVVDETGKVISAQAIDGPAPLRQAAEAAARQAKFEPTIKDGVTIKITGTLTYDF